MSYSDRFTRGRSGAIVRIALIVWCVLWAFFMIRELVLKRAAFDYARLLRIPLEGKRSYVTGDRLYEFIVFCGKALPEGASYEIVGMEEGALERRRAVYYLYPHLERRDAPYLLVFDRASASRPGYEPLAYLDGSRYILKKR